MVAYLLQTIAASALLYGYYHFFLRNEKFHEYNRFYLLAITILSLVLPLLKIPVFFSQDNDGEVIYRSLENFNTNVTIVASKARHFNWQMALYLCYACITGFSLFRIIIALRNIVRLKKQHQAEKVETVSFINTTHPDAPFSFFKWLFWNTGIELNSTKGKQIFKHEMYHIEKKHSWDLLLMECITAICWFNPFFHFIKSEIKTIQEFLADRYASGESKSHEYAELLLLQALNAPVQQRLINPFFHNQLKRRIAMLTTSKKSGYQWMRKLLVLPIAAVTVALFAFSYKKMSAELPLLNPVLNEKILRQNGDTAYYLNGKLSSKNEINNLPSNIIKMMTVLRGKDAEAVSPELKQVVKVETFTGREMLAGSTEDMVKSDTVPKEPEIFSKVEKDAEYPGNWRTFLQNTLNGEVAVKNGARPGNYTVIIQFIVDKDGTLSNVKALTKHGYGIEDEAIRVIQASGKWIPAMQKGHPVKAYRRQPIIFQIREVINEGTVDINWNQKDTTTTKPQVISEPEIFTKVEKEAEYPGNWTRFLEYNLDGKVAIQNRAPAGKYTTITQFIVNKDGTISDVKAIRKVGYGLDDEAVRVIKKSGKWKPAVQNGREVKAYRRQPITFMVRNP